MITTSESERGLIAAMMTDPSRIDRITTIVAGNDFEDPDLGRLFSALVDLHGKGEPVGDVIAIVPALRAMRLPAAVLEASFLYSLLQEGIASNAKFYARQIRRAAVLRRQHALAGELAARTADPAADPAAVASWLEGQLASLGQEGAADARKFGSVCMDFVASLEAGKASAKAMSGFVSHDDRIGGWRASEMIVLAARPGVGKTAWALQVARHNARHGRSVLFASLEMSAEELAARSLCGSAGVDSTELRSGDYDQSDVRRLSTAASDDHALPLWLWSPPSADLGAIRAAARCHAAQHGLDLLVVDYLGLVQPNDRRAHRFEQMGEVSRGLKCLAKELQTPILACCQLNREADGKPPLLSNLRDSGSIEQDADVVMFLHRQDPNIDQLEWIVAKHRHGPCGRFTLHFDDVAVRFTDEAEAEPIAWEG